MDNRKSDNLDMLKTVENRPPRVYLYSRVDGRSLFGFNDAYRECELEDQASFLNFELLDTEHIKIADVRENRGSGISDYALEKMLNAAQENQFDVLMTVDFDRLSRDPKRALDIMERLDEAGVYVYSLHEGWINLPLSDEEVSKYESVKARLMGKPDEELETLMDQIIEENIQAFETLE